MKKLIKLMVTGMVIAFVLVGCNNEDETVETSDNEVTEDTNEASETTGGAETNEAEGDEAASDETDSSSDSEGEILSLGETGTMETILGDFEVTPTAVQFLEEIEDESYSEPDNGVFVVVDVTLKNIGEEAIESSDIVSVDLFDLDGGSARNNPAFNAIENFEGEIATGEEMKGQLIFDFWETDSFQLAFGSAYTSDLSNEVRWEITADQAE